MNADETNAALAAAAPALHAALSPLGRRAAFPPDIPFQAAEARGSRYNATIGQITDGAGRPLPPPAIAAALAGLAEGDLDQALLYSPVQGIEEARRRWREWQRREIDADGESLPSSLPLATAGLTHGLSLLADLFATDGRAVAIASPFWGNYRQIFALRAGARIVSRPAFGDGVYDPEALAACLAELPEGEPAIALLNAPANPSGYSPTAAERERLVASLAGAAERRPLVALCDDAYAGLVHEPEIPSRSLFWDLLGVHERLVPVKVDGGTKEFSLFGARVGFLTFPFAEGTPAATALESKVKCLVRAGVGSPVATAQMLLLGALRQADAAAQVAAARDEMARRYRALKEALAAADPALLRPLPFNSGCFAVLELPAGLDADRVRRHLLAAHSTGVVALPPAYLRIAYCSVAASDLPELVARTERGVRELLA